MAQLYPRPEVLNAALREFIKNSDMTITTSKYIREAMVNKFCVDLTERKQVVTVHNASIFFFLFGLRL